MDITPRELLDLPLPENNSGAGTVRGYLVALLAGLWRKEEGFSGKHPFGDSDWQNDLYGPMVKAGIVTLTGEDCYLDDVAQAKADELILAAIAALGQP